jgi:hypothetical protein
VELSFSLTLPEALYQDLIEDCRNRSCSPKQFAAEALEAAIATKRLPHVVEGSHGPFSSGWKAKVEENSVEPEPYPVHCRITEGEL